MCIQLLSCYYISWNICLVDRHRKIHQEPRSRPFGRTALVEKARDQQLLDPNCAAKWWISNLSTSDFLNSTRMFIGSCPKKTLKHAHLRWFQILIIMARFLKLGGVIRLPEFRLMFCPTINTRKIGDNPVDTLGIGGYKHFPIFSHCKYCKPIFPL